ncbi:MAG TPA: hypothetical protein VK568_04005 [Thermodesulfobacteriota bacterium]|nr:hypothetical protein [Thermodesulfobacteriota bacterium]
MKLQSYTGLMYLCMLTDMSAFRIDAVRLKWKGFLREVVLYGKKSFSSKVLFKRVFG